jgi:hypothetical protein
MTDMPDPFKGADTVADLDSDHLLHLDALNLIQASRDGDDATVWAILALHSGSKKDLAYLARSLVWVAHVMLDQVEAVQKAHVLREPDELLAKIRQYLLGEAEGCQGHEDHGEDQP